MKIRMLGICLLLPALAHAGEDPLPKQAGDGLKKAVTFFRTKVSTEGGYLWRYSEDLSRREGEGAATATTAWVQPPGTPSVGLAYLQAYQATGEGYLLDAAKETAMALVRGQLLSGGWDYRIEFDTAKRKGYAYRVEPAEPKAKNITTLDDNNTQHAVRFLMRLDQAQGFKDQKIHEAVDYALTCLLKAQYPNGAWPQRFSDFPDPKMFPVKKASYPETWSRTWPAKAYLGFYTLNDNSLTDVVDIMLEAQQIYKSTVFLDAVRKAGDFLVLAQMPEPQPGWAQQYDLDMHPAWARKFEPPSVTGGESHGAMRTLLRIYRETGDKKYLEPIPRALAYFKKVELPGGRLARFYELQTSKPLYFTKDYQLTYSDADMPTHYGFKVSSAMDRIAKEYELLVKLDPAKLKPTPKKQKPSPPSEAQIAQVKKVLGALDTQGRWLEDGKLRYQGADDKTSRVISCQTFIQNVGTLAGYLASTKRE